MADDRDSGMAFTEDTDFEAGAWVNGEFFAKGRRGGGTRGFGERMSAAERAAAKDEARFGVFAQRADGLPGGGRRGPGRATMPLAGNGVSFVKASSSAAARPDAEPGVSGAAAGSDAPSPGPAPPVPAPMVNDAFRKLLGSAAPAAPAAAADVPAQPFHGGRGGIGFSSGEQPSGGRGGIGFSSGEQPSGGRGGIGFVPASAPLAPPPPAAASAPAAAAAPVPFGPARSSDRRAHAPQRPLDLPADFAKFAGVGAGADGGPAKSFAERYLERFGYKGRLGRYEQGTTSFVHVRARTGRTGLAFGGRSEFVPENAELERAFAGVDRGGAAAGKPEEEATEDAAAAAWRRQEGPAADDAGPATAAGGGAGRAGRGRQRRGRALRTAAELLEAEAEADGAGAGALRIVDMRSGAARVVAAADLGKAAADRGGSAAATAALPLRELRHNLRTLVDMAEVDVKGAAEQRREAADAARAAAARVTAAAARAATAQAEAGRAARLHRRAAQASQQSAAAAAAIVSGSADSQAAAKAAAAALDAFSLAMARGGDGGSGGAEAGSSSSSSSRAGSGDGMSTPEAGQLLAAAAGRIVAAFARHWSVSPHGAGSDVASDSLSGPAGGGSAAGGGGHGGLCRVADALHRAMQRVLGLTWDPAARCPGAAERLADAIAASSGASGSRPLAALEAAQPLVSAEAALGIGGAEARGGGAGPGAASPAQQAAARLVLRATGAALLPAVELALQGDWDARRDTPACLALVAAVATVSSAGALRRVVERAVGPALEAAATRWSATTDRLPPHAWVFPWLAWSPAAVLPAASAVLAKMDSALALWRPGDASALAVLAPWADVWGPTASHALAARRIAPRLAAACEAATVEPSPPGGLAPSAVSVADAVVRWGRSGFLPAADAAAMCAGALLPGAGAGLRRALATAAAAAAAAAAVEASPGGTINGTGAGDAATAACLARWYGATLEAWSSFAHLPLHGLAEQWRAAVAGVLRSALLRRPAQPPAVQCERRFLTSGQTVGMGGAEDAMGGVGPVGYAAALALLEQGLHSGRPAVHAASPGASSGGRGQPKQQRSAIASAIAAAARRAMAARATSSAPVTAEPAAATTEFDLVDSVTARDVVEELAATAGVAMLPHPLGATVKGRQAARLGAVTVLWTADALFAAPARVPASEAVAVTPAALLAMLSV